MRSGYTKRTYTGPRPWENTDAAPFSDVIDQSRGDLRLAAEYFFARCRGERVPSNVHTRAILTLHVLADK